MTDTNEAIQQTTTEQHIALQEAFYPWITGEYPEAKCIGDVVVAMAIADQNLTQEEVN